MKTKLLILLFLASFSTYAQTNLVPNGGFETWTNSTTLSNWTIENSVTQNTSSYTEGSKSAQLYITNGTTKPKITVLVPMAAGTTYTVKFKYKYVSANFSGQHPISLNISQNGSATTLSSSTFATDNNWTVKETSFTPDQTLSYDLNISLYTFDTESFDVLIDDVQVYIQGTEQYTLIPDVNFENKLIALGIDSGAKDGKVLTNSVNKLTTLDLSSSFITDLTGIQDFVALKTLDCYNNKLTTLDVSKNISLTSLSFDTNQLTTIDIAANIALTNLRCNSNKLTSLDVSKNEALTNLSCSFNQIPSLDVSKNLNLASLNCNYNQISTLTISKNLGLKSLSCYSNKLTALDVTQNIALTSLTCASNQITNLDVTKNVGLTYLYCGYNKLSTIDVSSNIALTTLMCLSNQLISLDVSKNIQLEKLECEYNKLTTLDVSKNLQLQKLECWENTLTNLDVSKNTLLNLIKCDRNKLTRLNLKNGQNSLLTKFNINFKDNPLSCIQVDNVEYSNTNWDTAKNTTTIYSNLDCDLITKIPDPKFEDKLIALAIDTDGKNGYVLTSNIIAVTTLDISNSNIVDLTGIQYFTALETLNCSSNLFVTLDFSKNFTLKTLTCNNNLSLKSLNLKNGKNTLLNSTSSSFTGNPSLTCIQVDNLAYANTNWTSVKDTSTSFNTDCTVYTLIPDPKFEAKLIGLGIDKDGVNGKVATSSIASLTYLNVCCSAIKDLTGIQDFVALTDLYCHRNELANLDVSKNIALTSLGCDTNQLSSLDVSKNVSLISLSCDGNQISSLDLTKNTALKGLSISHFGQGSSGGGNGLFTTIDVSKNVALEYLNCEQNKLNSLDLSNNLLLKELKCGQNQLTTLDVSKNTALTSLSCDSNQLLNLNLKNGKNTLLSISNFKTNPNLNCIQVDDVSYSNTNWSTRKDLTANYSDSCTFIVAYTTIADTNFEDKLIALGIDQDGKNGKVATASISNLKTLNVSNSNITDLTGIKDFASLVSLVCNNNKLNKLDLSDNGPLTKLDCSSNFLSELSIYNNTSLSDLNCSLNAINNLEVSKNTNLTILSCGFNKLVNLDITKNTSLRELECANNNLYNLNLKNGNNSNMQRMIFGNFTNNPNLTCIQVDNAAYSSTNWIAKDTNANYSEDCTPFTKYTLIPDANFEKKLISLGIDSGVVDGKVETIKIAAVTTLNVSYSSITDMTGIQDFTALKTLNCSLNPLTLLDVSKNTDLVNLNVRGKISNSYSGENGKIVSLDVSKNTLLSSLDCAYNQITSLEVSKNLALTSLDCSDNKLTSLDVTNNIALTSLVCFFNTLPSLDVSKNIALVNLECRDNPIKSLNVSQNKSLSTLDCGSNGLTSLDVTNNLTLTSLQVFGNQLTSLNVTKNVALVSLSCGINSLTSLDVSKNTALTKLYVFTNPLTSLDVSNNLSLTSLTSKRTKLTSLDISKNMALTSLDCSENELTTLDVSKNYSLTTLDCSYNKLQNLNLKNGKNTLINKYNISLKGNPNLYCILVDDVAYSNTNWTNNKDVTATYNIECNGLTLPINNFNVESKGETCLNSNNGEINISATAAYTYKASINGTLYSFTNNSLKVPNLTPGTYTISITIPGETFEQSFSVIIPKGATITGKSSVAANKVSIEITEGTAPYTVFVDGVEQFETTDSSFSVETKKGGLLQVKTAKACEGIYAKDFARLDGAISAYPNPTSGSFEIELPTIKKEVAIALYTLDGNLISTKTYTVENGKAQLSLENQPAGVYVAKIELDTPDYLKIIKN